MLRGGGGWGREGEHARSPLDRDAEYIYSTEKRKIIGQRIIPGTVQYCTTVPVQYSTVALLFCTVYIYIYYCSGIVYSICILCTRVDTTYTYHSDSDSDSDS